VCHKPLFFGLERAMEDPGFGPKVGRRVAFEPCLLGRRLPAGAKVSQNEEEEQKCDPEPLHDRGTLLIRAMKFQFATI
jgi:hypothetical protein